VKDSNIADLTSDLNFAVESGAASTTYQQFPASSVSSSSMIFQVQVPSENIVLGRDPLLRSSIEFTMTVRNVVASTTEAGKYLNYGLTDSFMPFPLSSLMTTATAQINNTTTSVNLQDVLPQFQRLNNDALTQKYNNMTPCMPDQNYAQYSDAAKTNSNCMGSYSNAGYNNALVPRGAFPVEITYKQYNPSPFDTATPPVARDNTIPVATGDIANTSQDVGNYCVITIKAVVSEPLFLSPFTWCEPEHNAQGLLGINNMNFNFSMDSTMKRLWSTSQLQSSVSVYDAASKAGSHYTTMTAGIDGGNLFSEQPSLLFKFLSTQPSDKVETKNVCPYMDFPRYLTSQANTTSVASNSSVTLTSSNLQINQIPDKFVICVRKPMTSQGLGDSNSFLAIESVSLNFNNQSGLLSSASKQDLWRMSQENGSEQSWYEFCGQAFDNNAGGLSTPGLVQTVGSLLVISPPRDMSLPDYLTSGSLGNFNLQFSISVKNYSSGTITPEICVIAVNSGLFVTQQGVSSVYTGILTKEAVLNAKDKEPVPSKQVERLVGGKLGNKHLASIAKGVGKDAVRRVHEEVNGGSMGVHASGGGLSGLY